MKRILASLSLALSLLLLAAPSSSHAAEPPRVLFTREEPATPKSPGTGLKDEKPIATPAIACDLRMPPGFRQPRVMAFTPESPTATPIEAKFADGRLRFEVPGFLVYAVVQVEAQTE